MLRSSSVASARALFGGFGSFGSFGPLKMAAADTAETPTRYRTKLLYYPKEAKQVALNVLGALLEEGGTSVSLRTVVKRTAKLTNVSERALFKWMAEYNKDGTVTAPLTMLRGGKNCERETKLDDFDLGMLRTIVHGFYLRNEAPTVAKLQRYIDQTSDLPSVSLATLHRMLRKLGFRYCKRSSSAHLIECPNIIRRRRKYLHQIKKYRQQKRSIYYTDETWVSAGHTKSQVWAHTTTGASEAKRSGPGPKNLAAKGERLIITHCGSESGFVDGAAEVFRAKRHTGRIHREIDGPHYVKWFTERLLPNLAPNSVIVMDDAPYHSLETERVPEMATRKKDVQDWLSAKGISWSKGLVKAELLKLVSTVNDEDSHYLIDLIAAQFGHTVLRLPPYHCHLNPIELIWSQVKGYVASENKTFKIDDLEPLVTQALARVTPEKWAHCCGHVIVEEDKMMKVDNLIDDVVDSVVINVGKNDTSSTDSDCELDEDVD